MKRVTLLAAIFFAAAACGSFGPAQPHTLSLAYKAGDTYKYKFHSSTKQTVTMSGEGLPTQIDVVANESVKVNSVDGSGAADLSITFSNFTVKSVAAGITNTTTGIPSNTTEVKIAADGTISSVAGNQIQSGNPLALFSGFGGGFFISAVLPDHPVKPGDKWSKTYDQAMPSSFMSGSSHIMSDSTYLRDETLNGVTAAVVETKSTGTISVKGAPEAEGAPPGNITMNVDFTTDVTTWIDPSGHRIMKSHGTAHDQGTVDFSNPPTTRPGIVSPTPLPVMGPISSSGDSTTDLTPA